MYYWGIAINIISSILIVLSIGLCVDYAAHIGLAFLITPGSSKDDRAKKALQTIGPAVLNGGFSTFLSISLMAASKSLAFISFFKIFTIVVVFGLWHGLLFLPVVLSILGPEPYPEVFAQSDSSTGNHNSSALDNKVFSVASYCENGEHLPLQTQLASSSSNGSKYACDNGHTKEKKLDGDSEETKSVKDALMFIDDDENLGDDDDTV